jgi:hypothetical protein
MSRGIVSLNNIIRLIFNADAMFSVRDVGPDFLAIQIVNGLLGSVISILPM